MKRREPVFSVGETVAWSDNFGHGHGTIVRMDYDRNWWSWAYTIKTSNGFHCVWENRIQAFSDADDGFTTDEPISDELDQAMREGEW